MIKSVGKLTLAGILAALVVGIPLSSLAQDKTPAAPAATTPAAPAKPHPLPFHGRLGSVDKVNKTITMDDKNKRVFKVTSETKITNNAKPATLDDVTAGEIVGGSFLKDADGKMTAKTLNFRTAQFTAPPPTAPAPKQ